MKGLLLALGAIFLLRGANTAHSLSKLAVTFRGIQFAKDYKSIVLILSFYNPSTMDIVLTNGLLQVFANEKNVGTIRIDKNMVIKSGFTNLNFNLEFNFLQILQFAGGFTGKGSIKFVIDGTINSGAVTFPVNSTYEFKL